MNDSAEEDVKLIAADRYKKSWSRWRDFLFQDQGVGGEIPDNNAVDERQDEEEEEEIPEDASGFKNLKGKT